MRLDKTRIVLAKKKEENDKILAEVSISSNAQVTAANEKETELLKRIAEFLNTSVESISDEQPGNSKFIRTLFSPLFRPTDETMSQRVRVRRSRQHGKGK